MKKEKEKGITEKKEENTAEWYEQVCLKAELADFGPVSGTFIIKPYGYAIWQKIQDYFNERLKKLGVENVYFPLFIPESFFKKEKEHAEGFEAEVAWLEKKDEKEERIALRPTSETVMYDAFSKWIRSWRDLPLKINQWCNIVRWEVSQCKLFLRSREFLWQEGHCVYETEEECEKETLQIINEYERLCRELLAIPILKGRKTEKEKFAGAFKTYAIETLMPDGKALQCGTSHNLGQGFAKVFNINFLNKKGEKQVPWQNSWGISTRLIGATVMIHSDNKGLVLPPKIAPIQIIIVPIIFEKTKQKVLEEARKLKNILKKYKVQVDEREGYSAGWKFNEWELKGVPLRIEIGPKDIEKKEIVLVRRDDGKKRKVKIKKIKEEIEEELKNMQERLYKKAEKFLKESIKKVSSWKDFLKVIKEKKIALAPFCGSVECEEIIKSKSGGASSRVIEEELNGKEKCIYCDKKAKFSVYFAKSY